MTVSSQIYRKFVQSEALHEFRIPSAETPVVLPCAGWRTLGRNMRVLGDPQPTCHPLCDQNLSELRTCVHVDSSESLFRPVGIQQFSQCCWTFLEVGVRHHIRNGRYLCSLCMGIESPRIAQQWRLKALKKNTRNAVTGGCSFDWRHPAVCA